MSNASAEARAQCAARLRIVYRPGCSPQNVASFESYNRLYGSLGAGIGFMVWIWISVVVILIGAELNAEMEHQTARDTTAGVEKPLGMRGAIMADRVGPAQS